MTTEQKTALSYSPFETIRTPDGKVDHSFGPYSETREHLDPWLPKLLGELGVSDGLNVELGSGRGHSAEFILPYVGISGKLIMSEPDDEGYRVCVERYGNVSGVQVSKKTALEALADLEDGSVNRVYYLNAIHLDEDREKVIELAFHKLKPGGLLIVNSAFTGEAEPDSEEPMYRRWMQRALRKLAAQDRELFRSIAGSEHMRRLTKQEYDRIFCVKGFKLRDLSRYGLSFEQPDSQLKNSLVGLFRIAQYDVWIEGTMPVVRPDEVVSEHELERRLDLVTVSQQVALLEVYPEMIGRRISPRNNAIWVAEKPLNYKVSVELRDGVRRPVPIAA